MDYQGELKIIADHFKDVDSAIQDYFARILAGDLRKRPDLAGVLIEEIEELRDKRLLENERAVALIILAAIEAWFRIDCETRAKKREKSEVGRRFKKMYAAAGQSIARVRFEDILNAWSKNEPRSKQIIGQVKSAFKYRHWLAHGRYWTPKLGRGYNYAEVYGVANKAAILLINS